MYLNLKKLLRVSVMVVFMGFLFMYAVRRNSMIQPIDYSEHLSDVAVSVDERQLTLRDLSFYVLYEEMTIETEAEVYNKKNTRDFWNLHSNGIFFKAAAKKCVMDMAVHDDLFYHEAKDAGMELSAEDRDILKNSYNDFLDDLFLVQCDSPLYDEELIFETMEHIALAEKYQGYLADRDQTTYAAYGYDGYDYNNYIEEHNIKINDAVWDRVSIGDNTLIHKSASGVNGQILEEVEDE